MMRKNATAARVARIIEPAKSAEPENHRSPGRCLALPRGSGASGSGACGSVGAEVVDMSASCMGESGVRPRTDDIVGPGPEGLLDRVDRSLRLLGQAGRDRGAARGGGGRLLTGLADRGAEEALHQGCGVGVGVLDAADQVA